MRFVLVLPAAVALLGCAASPRATSPDREAMCSGVSPAERSALFASRASVRRLIGTWETENKKFSRARVIGAEVVLRAEPGQSRERLERVALCEAPPSARVRVLSLEGAYAVQMTSDDPTVANEIVARAER